MIAKMPIVPASSTRLWPRTQRDRDEPGEQRCAPRTHCATRDFAARCGSSAGIGRISRVACHVDDVARRPRGSVARARTKSSATDDDARRSPRRGTRPGSRRTSRSGRRCRARSAAPRSSACVSIRPITAAPSAGSSTSGRAPCPMLHADHAGPQEQADEREQRRDDPHDGVQALHRDAEQRARGRRSRRSPRSPTPIALQRMNSASATSTIGTTTNTASRCR